MDFLDFIAIVSFTMQLQNNELLRKQATNDDIIDDLHADVDRLDQKLDTIIKMIELQKPSSVESSVS